MFAWSYKGILCPLIVFVCYIHLLYIHLMYIFIYLNCHTMVLFITPAPDKSFYVTRMPVKVTFQDFVALVALCGC